MNTRFRKTVQGLFTGAQFEIAKVSMKLFMEEVGDLPISLAAAVRKDMDLEKQVSNLTPTQLTEANRRSETCMIKHGVQRIRFSENEPWTPAQFWFGTQDTCPPEFIMASDLGSDFDLLVEEVVKHSFALEGVRNLERFFRGARGLDAGFSSETLRPTPLADAPLGDDSH